MLIVHCIGHGKFIHHLFHFHRSLKLHTAQANRAGEAGLLNEHRKGEWRRVAYNVFTATAVKEKEHTEITLSILGNVARMQCKETDKIYGDEFNGECPSDASNVITTNRHHS